MIRKHVAKLTLLAVGLATSFRVCAQMPIYGDYFAHDPSTMIKQGTRYYIFYTGFAVPYKWSTDLRNWTWSAFSHPDHQRG